MSRKLVSFSLLILILILAFGGAARAQDKTLYWQRYDVDLAPQKNGDLHVAETQELVFTNGTFRYGQRAIPQNRLGEIKNIQVRELDGPVYENAETDAPYTYRVFQEGGETKIRYNFPPTSDSRRTIVIDYDVTDALRYYPENGVDQLYWKAVPAGNPFPTQSSTITLHAPEPATFTNYGIYGAKAAADFQPGQRDATIKVRGPINSGQEVEVVAEWQHGVVAGQPPAWQRELDQQAAAKKAQDVFQQRWGPVFGLGFLSLAGLLIIGGPVLLYLWWYRKGRDPAVGLVADYLPEPPSDLPAGMVGTLIDESADMQDILATVLDLARRGALTIKETQEPGFLGIGTISDFVYRRDLRFPETLRPYEDTLLDNMFASSKEVKLSDLKNKFYTAVPTIRKQLYQAVVAEGYLAGNPETVRTTYGCLGGAALVAAIIGGFFFAAILAQYSGFAFCIPIEPGGDRHRRDHPGALHAAPDQERLGRSCALAGVQTLPAKPGEIHQDRGSHGDLRALSALCGGVRSGAELHPQVREGGCAASDLVDPLRDVAAVSRRWGRRLGGRRTCARPRRTDAERGWLSALT